MNNNYGRRCIYTSERIFTTENVKKIVDRAMSVHNANVCDIQRLFNYYRGHMDILDRVKEVRPEICNKVVINHAAEITNFKVGFTFGEPVQYVYRGKDTVNDAENRADDDSIAALNKLMYRLGKSSKDRELAQWLFICGVAQRITLYDGKDINTYVCDPRSTFTIRANDYSRRVLLSVVLSSDDVLEDINVTPKMKYAIYSDNHFWRFEDNVCVEEKAITQNPVVEYWANPTRQGCFETVIEIIDELNNIASNRADDIEQNVQSLTWFNNVEIDDKQFSELSQKGGICTKSSPNLPASIQLLQNTLDQSQSQVYVDDLYQKMLQIAAVPDRKASAGGNTGQALIIGEGWTQAESAAKSFEQSFDESEKLFVDNVLAIIKTVNTATTSPGFFSNLSVDDVDIKFTRNKTDNLLTKTQGLQNQLEAGIHPRIAIEACGLYSDPQQVYMDSEEYLAKWKQQGEQDKQAVMNAADNPGAADEFDEIFRKLTGGEDNGTESA